MVAELSNSNINSIEFSLFGMKYLQRASTHRFESCEENIDEKISNYIDVDNMSVCYYLLIAILCKIPIW